MMKEHPRNPPPPLPSKKKDYKKGDLYWRVYQLELWRVSIREGGPETGVVSCEGGLSSGGSEVSKMIFLFAKS